MTKISGCEKSHGSPRRPLAQVFCFIVMRGLDPRIHLISKNASSFLMDCRVKPGNDGPER
jgi:hypothetical protein